MIRRTKRSYAGLEGKLGDARLREVEVVERAAIALLLLSVLAERVVARVWRMATKPPGNVTLAYAGLGMQLYESGAHDQPEVNGKGQNDDVQGCSMHRSPPV